MSEGMAKVTGTRQTRPWALKAALATLGIGVLFAFIGLAPSCSRVDGGPAATYGALATGAMAKFAPAGEERFTPEATIYDAAGAPMRLTDLRGQVLVVNYWATWCAPCVKEMPTLAKLQAAFAGTDLMVTPISVDKDQAKAEARLAEIGADLPFYHDPKYESFFEVNGKGFPTTIIYGRDGREIGRLLGDADWSSPEAKMLIERALAES